MALSKQARDGFYSNYTNTSLEELNNSINAVRSETKDLIEQYGTKLKELQAQSTQELLNAPAVKKVRPFFRESTSIHLYGDKEARQKGDSVEKFNELQNAFQKSLSKLPALRADVTQSIFNAETLMLERVNSTHKDVARIQKVRELVALEKLRDILKSNLLNMETPCAEQSIEELRYSVWQLGYDASFGYRADPFKIIGGIIVGIILMCTVIFIPMALDILVGIKYEDSEFVNERSELGPFDRLYEDLSELFINKDIILQAKQDLATQTKVNAESAVTPELREIIAVFPGGQMEAMES